MDAMNDFHQQLRPYIGNLAEVHEAFDGDHVIPASTLAHDFTIISWRVAGDEKAYRLR